MLTTFRPRRRWRLPQLTRADAVPIGLCALIALGGLLDLAKVWGLL